ncbi:hypothetical protein [Streptomyces antimycoticus]|uniref:hypothetical protein n=1 Tax=Streptomyces antimycoticus TaxID=68175 RepID=UPI00118052E8|nr:hypothetical protein [Streptomyces antimycoticus]
MTTSLDERNRDGTRIIGALEAAWSAIQKRHPEVPPVVVITGTGAPRRGGKYLKRGHHSPERWAHAAEERRTPELFVAGEVLHEGGAAVMEVLLHEASHALGFVREIKGTANGNRWHNKKFAALAIELGLEPPKRAEPVLGFSSCTITPEAVRTYGTVIRRLEAARLPFLDGLAGGSADGEKDPDDGEGGKKKTGGRREAVECDCEPPRRLHITAKMLREGDVLCGVCCERFTPAEPAEESAEPEEK